MVELEPDGIDVAALERVLAAGARPKLAHIIPNFQNPAGYTLSAEKRERLLELAREPRVHDLRGRPVRGAALRGRAAADDALDGPGRHRRLRLVVLEDRLSRDPGRLPGRADRADRAGRQDRDPDVHLAEHGLAGDRPPVLRLGRDRASRSRSCARRCTSAPTRCARRSSASFPTPASSSRSGGYFLWVDLPRGTDVGALFEAAAERGVQFVKGSDFVLDGGESSLRLAYSGVTPEEIEEGVKRLAERLHDLAGGVEERACGLRRSPPSATSRARRPPAPTRQIHECTPGIAGRVWRRVGPAAIPVKIAHDRIAGARLRRRRRADPRGRPRRRASRERDAGRLTPPRSSARLPAGPSSARSTARSATRSSASGNALALPMTFRRARARPRAHAPKRSPTPTRTPSRGWRSSSTACARPTTPGMGYPLARARHVPYGHRMEIELGYSPLYLRYNTGRHISENGRELAELLERPRRRLADRVARGRADRPFDGRARRAERLPLRRRQRLRGQGPPRGHARDAPPRRPARAGHERRHRRARAPPRDAPAGRAR